MVNNTTWQEVIVDGHLDTHFAYIREHLEYVRLTQAQFHGCA
jgi:hypothetical protein